ncbi:DUF7677 family protein [Micromonospora matsumotoense]|uniref:DUF7677 family protein n=1 Tax=Micromonospora matsumotoense TaxID=121616 RepID=UPI003F4D556D
MRPGLRCDNSRRPVADPADGRVGRWTEGASGAIRRFAGWGARGSVGHLMLEGTNYWLVATQLPSGSAASSCQAKTRQANVCSPKASDSSDSPINRSTGSASPQSRIRLGQPAPGPAAPRSGDRGSLSPAGPRDPTGQVMPFGRWLQ